MSGIDIVTGNGVQVEGGSGGTEVDPVWNSEKASYSTTVQMNSAISSAIAPIQAEVDEIEEGFETVNNVLYVSTGGDDTNTGICPQRPFKTLTKALEVVQPGQEIMVFPGIYPEDAIISVDNISITGGYSEERGIVDFSGSIEFSHSGTSCSLTGIYVNALTISGPGHVYLYNCSTNSLVKSGSGYLRVYNCDLQGSGNTGTVELNGSGLCEFTSSTRIGALAFGNSGAQCIIHGDCISLPINQTSGSLLIRNSIVYSADATSNAITSEAGTIALQGVLALTPEFSPARINIATGVASSLSYVSIDNTNSTLDGTSIGLAVTSDSYIPA